MMTRAQHLLSVLDETKRLLARKSNDFRFSRWKSSEEACGEIQSYIDKIQKTEVFEERALVVLFAPTGSIQEASLRGGWGEEYLSLADRFDNAVARFFGVEAPGA